MTGASVMQEVTLWEGRKFPENMADTVTQPVADRSGIEIALPCSDLKLQKIVPCNPTGRDCFTGFHAGRPTFQN